MRDLLLPLLKNSKSGVDDRGHRLRITHTRRRRLVTSFYVLGGIRHGIFHDLSDKLTLPISLKKGER